MRKVARIRLMYVFASYVLRKEREKCLTNVSCPFHSAQVGCETKTKDNVFVKVLVAIQYKVMEDKVWQ